MDISTVKYIAPEIQVVVTVRQNHSAVGQTAHFSYETIQLDCRVLPAHMDRWISTSGVCVSSDSISARYQTDACRSLVSARLNINAGDHTLASDTCNLLNVAFTTSFAFTLSRSIDSSDKVYEG